MTWVRRAEKPTPAHRCVPPTVGTFVTVPPPPPSPSGFGGGGEPQRVKFGDVPGGGWGDLWRCDDCGELWRVGSGCDRCDPGLPSGRCGLPLQWRPATWRQKRRFRR